MRLVDVVELTQQLTTWATWVQGRAAAELLARTEGPRTRAGGRTDAGSPSFTGPLIHPDTPAMHAVLPDGTARLAARQSAAIAEIALAAGISTDQAWHRARRAERLAARFPRAEARAALGGLAQVKTDILLDAASHLCEHEAARLDAVADGRPDPGPADPGPADPVPADPGRAAPGARLRPVLDPTHRTPAQWRADLARRVARLDAPAAESAHAEEAAKAGVRFLAEPFGMATLSVYGTATDILTVKTALDALADDYRRGPAAYPELTDPNRPGQRLAAGQVRVAALLSWATAALAATTPGDAAFPAAGRGGRPSIVITMPVSTASGGGDTPGELTGYGPIPASLARAAASDATWTCALTDDTGTVVALGHSTWTPTYTAPRRLRRFLVVKHRICRFPTCTRPARDCDSDHLRNYPDGPTCEHNLAPLCRRHHNLKTHHRWTVRDARPDESHPPGTLVWTSPTGRKHPDPPPEPLDDLPARRDPGGTRADPPF